MPFNGAGVFQPLPAPNFPAVPGTTIASAYFNANVQDIFTGLGNCVTRDGQSPATSNLPMGGFKLTGLSAGSSANDSVRYAQLAAFFDPANGSGADLVANADRSIATIADLRAFPKPSLAAGRTMVVTVMEYATGSGAGGGNFRWQASSSEADDAGRVINPTGNAGTGRWIRVTPQLRVEEYGIFPDGADYTAQMQALVDNLSAGGGGVINLAAGTYVFSVVLKSGVEIVGAAIGAYVSGAIPYRTRVQGSLTKSIIFDTPRSALVEAAAVRRVTMVGRGAGTPYIGMWIESTRSCQFTDIGGFDFADQLLVVEADSRLNFFKNWFAYNCLLNRTRAANIYVADFRKGSGDTVVEDFEVGPSIFALVSANRYLRAIGVAGDNYWFSRAYGEFGEVGINLYGDSSCAFNRFDLCRGEFSMAENWILEPTIGGEHVFLGCEGNQGSVGSPGVYDSWVNNRGNNRLIGCAIRNIPGTYTGPSRDGFVDTVASDNEKSQYIGCRSTGNSRDDWKFQPSGPGVSYIDSDAIFLTANSATPTLRVPFKNYRTNSTVATTITAFNGTVPGMEVVLFAGDANTTIQHNGATFVLPGAVNLPLVSGKIYVFKRFGGAFRLVSASP